MQFFRSRVTLCVVQTRRHAGDENATTTTTAKSYYSRRTNNVSNVAQKARGPRRALGDVTNRHAAAYGRVSYACSGCRAVVAVWWRVRQCSALS